MRSRIPSASCSAQISERSDKNGEKLLGSLSFSRQLQIVCSQDLLSPLREKLESITYPISYSASLTLSDLLKPEILDQYIIPKSAVALSTGSLDNDDILAIENGVLYLSLTPNTYYSVGLIGENSKSNRDKYLVQVDLTEQYYAKGTKKYARLEWVAANTLTKSWNMVISLPSPNFPLQSGASQILPSKWSEKKQFSVLTPTFTAPSTDNTLDLPPSGLARYQEETTKEWASSIYEWIGMASLASELLSLHHNIDSYLSQYEVLDPSSSSMDITVLRLTGMYNSAFIKSVWEQLDGLSSPLCIYSVYGAQNSPISWNSRDHKYGLNEGNGCSLVSLDGNKLVTFKQSTV